MDTINNLPNQYIRGLYRGIVTLLFLLAVFFAIKSLAELRSYSMMGVTGNTITLSGHGEVFAIPDIANVSFTIMKEAKTVKEAQEAVAVIEKSALDFLKTHEVDSKDIKTENASFNPKYEYVYNRIMAPCSVYGCPPNPGKNTITGYEASESITIKIRNTEDVGAIIQGLGGVGVTNLNGPNFAVDNEDALKAEARKKAIDNAEQKAEDLASDLGVSLGRIANFSESGNYPIMYAGKATMSLDSAVAPMPAELPVGQNTITSDVTITYDIR